MFGEAVPCIFVLFPREPIFLFNLDFSQSNNRTQIVISHLAFFEYVYFQRFIRFLEPSRYVCTVTSGHR